MQAYRFLKLFLGKSVVVSTLISVLLTASFSVVSCSTGNKREEWIPAAKTNPAYRAYHQKVLLELNANVQSSLQRRPAADLQQLKISLNQLRTVKPAKFEVYVFPKLTNQIEKNSEEVYVDLGRPEVYEITASSLSPCQQYVNKGLEKSRKANEMFADLVSEANFKQRTCGIVDVVSKRMRTLDRALVRPGDVEKISLFVDDSYGVHGYAITFWNDISRNPITQTVKADLLEGVSSGLSQFPIDLPIFGNSSATNMNLKELVGPKLDALSLKQVQKLNAKIQTLTPDCKGQVFRYSDYYRLKNEVAWCESSPWPNAIETNRYLAITQPLGGK